MDLLRADLLRAAAGKLSHKWSSVVHKRMSEMAVTVAIARWLRFTGCISGNISASQEVQFGVGRGLHSKNPQHKCMHEN